MVDTVTLQARLTEAEAAYHEVMTGSGIAKIGRGQNAVEYTRATVGQLNVYIASLKKQLGLGTRRTYRPIF